MHMMCNNEPIALKISLPFLFCPHHSSLSSWPQAAFDLLLITLNEFAFYMKS
jgi:hypothetical protein